MKYFTLCLIFLASVTSFANCSIYLKQVNSVQSLSDLSKSLVKKGFKITENKDFANYYLDVDSNCNSDFESCDNSIIYSTLNYSLYIETSEVLYQRSLDLFERNLIEAILEGPSCEELSEIKESCIRD